METLTAPKLDTAKTMEGSGSLQISAGKTMARTSGRFDEFLQGYIGLEANGDPLTVISALARQDIDPVTEAGALASVPRAAARERMAQLIAPFTAAPTDAAEREALAFELVERLHGGASSDPAPVARTTGPKPAPRAAQSAANLSRQQQILLFVTILSLLLSLQFLSGASRSTQAPPPGTSRSGSPP